MNHSSDIQEQFNSITPEEKDMLNRINAYSNQVMGDIDPQKTPVSQQLEKLKPIMQEIADEKNVSLEEVFIQYMDLASVISAKKEARLKEDLDAAGLTDFTRMN